MNVAEKVEAKPYEEQLRIVQDSGFKCPPNYIMIVAPVVEEKTKGGIIKPANVMSTEERANAYFRFHKILAVADNVEAVKVGDAVWLGSSATINKIVLDETVFIVTESVHLIGIIPNKD